MKTFADDPSKTIVLFVNDFNHEYVAALDKLSKKLGRKLQGIVLIDSKVKAGGQNKPIVDNLFDEMICDYDDLGSLSSVLNSIKPNVLLVSVSSERNQPYFAKLIPHLEFCYLPSESSIEWSVSKQMMREMFSAYDDSITVKSILINKYGAGERKEILDHFSFPVIIKPNGLAASILVKKANNASELDINLKQIFESIKKLYSRDSGRGEPSVVVEEFIDGDMYSVDSYVNHEGKVWSLPLVKVITANSIGLEGFYSYSIESKPSLSSKDVKDAHAAAHKAIHALRLRSCVAHIELFKTTNGWKVIELGPRAGGYRQVMYELSYDIDHAYNELLIRCGLPPKISTKHKCYTSALKIYPENEGIISKIDGFDTSQMLTSVNTLTLHKKPGDEALFCGNGGKFVIDGILANKNYDQLTADVDNVRKLIKISTI